MTPQPHEVVLDDRRRTSLARIGNKDHAKYLAQEFDDGTIILTPAVTVTAAELEMLRNPSVVEALKVAEANDPSTLHRRRAPRRRRGE